MLCGGVEKSLLSLLNFIDKEKYNITLLLLKKRGVLLDQIPSYVNVIEMDLPQDEEYDILFGKTNALKKAFHDRKYFLFLKKFIRGIYLNLISNSDEEKRVNYYKMIDVKFSKLDDEYDIAVDYMGYGLLNTFFVAKKIKAKSKFTWVHFEPNIGMESFKAFKYYLIDYNKIICVSEDIKKQVARILPELNGKLNVFYNIVDRDYIINESKIDLGFTDINFDGKKILSIGRLDLQKGFDLAIPVINKLIQEGYNLRWYIIGEGNLRKELEELIKEFNLEKYIYLLGQKTNPYSYLSQCDYYFQPSRHEGYGIAVAEARVFCKPILATDFAGAKEQLRNKETGLIVKCNQKEFYEGLKSLLDDEQLCSSLIQNLERESTSKKNISNDIDVLLGGIK